MTMVAARTNRRRVGIMFSSLFLWPVMKRSNEQLAGDESAGLRRCWERKRTRRPGRSRSRGRDAGARSRRRAAWPRRRSCVDITTLMPRATTARMTSSIALVAAGIEACGRLVEQQHLRLLGQRARERKPLLLAAGELACRTIAEPVEADERAELAGARLAFRARHAGGRQRIADVAGGAATKHRRALEHDGAMRRRHVLAAAPGHASVRGRHQAHDERAAAWSCRRRSVRSAPWAIRPQAQARSGRGSSRRRRRSSRPRARSADR